MENKKGIQLNQAFGAVLTLVLVAVLVIIAIVIFVNLSSSFAGTSTVTETNESSHINDTGYTLAGAGNCSFASPAISLAINATDNTTISASDIALTAAGVVSNATAANYADTLITYTYTWGSEACDASDSMITEFDNYTSLIGLVGTIIFLGLVIGVLVASFVFSGRKEV